MTNALTINNLPPIASLDLYIQAVNRIPLLSASEELGLAKRLKEEEDLDAAKSLVMSHLRLVVSIARRFNGYGLPFGDLIQELILCLLILCVAARRDTLFLPSNRLY